MHDPIYRRLFAFPRMVRDLLGAVGNPDWLGDVDLNTLEKLPAEHVGDSGQQRRGDAIWRARFRNGWLYLLVLLEFQSRSDTRMALRNLEYTALLYRELDRRGELGTPGRWPPVLPVVLYNGDAPWTAALEMRDLVAPVPAVLSPCQPSQRSLLLDERRVAVDDLPSNNLMRAVVGFEQSRTPVELARVAEALRDWLSPQDSNLGRAFAAWVRQLVARFSPGQAGQELGETLEEATMTLVERVAQWPEQWRREGVAEGRREGRREAVAGQRALLCRVAATRFGEAVGERVERLLGDTDDWERLSAAAELIAAAQNDVDLIDAVSDIVRRPG
ncbi:MAG: Rpn family recombination-promoting nuclease/putative transposase [Gammaproteobacteria bacterium]|nr:Rpn family recombination-promoting nuclease/putative transposase [Gammaproteobacteria bacterium]